MKATIQPSTLDDGLKPYNWIKFTQKLLTWRATQWRCVLCGDHALAIAICGGCQADLPWRERPWRKRLAGIDTLEVCFDFAYPIRQLLHRAKYGRDVAIARLLGELFAGRLSVEQIPAARSSVALFPVPMARRRLLFRGYNQAVEIAEPLSLLSSIPLDVVSVYKRRGSTPQSKLGAANRRSNIRDAFVCRQLPEVDTAIVIDDVITTGATVQAMARTLRAAGVGNVHVWALAVVE